MAAAPQPPSPSGRWQRGRAGQRERAGAARGARGGVGGLVRQGPRQVWLGRGRGRGKAGRVAVGRGAWQLALWRPRLLTRQRRCRVVAAAGAVAAVGAAARCLAGGGGGGGAGGAAAAADCAAAARAAAATQTWPAIFRSSCSAGRYVRAGFRPVGKGGEPGVRFHRTAAIHAVVSVQRRCFTGLQECGGSQDCGNAVSVQQDVPQDCGDACSGECASRVKARCAPACPHPSRKHKQLPHLSPPPPPLPSPPTCSCMPGTTPATSRPLR